MPFVPSQILPGFVCAAGTRTEEPISQIRIHVASQLLEALPFVSRTKWEVGSDQKHLRLKLLSEPPVVQHMGASFAPQTVLNIAEMNQLRPNF